MLHYHCNKDRRLDTDGANKKTVLDKAIDMLHRQRVVIHLRATLFTAFGKPSNHFLTRLQVDIVPKGKRHNTRRPIGHCLCLGMGAEM